MNRLFVVVIYLFCYGFSGGRCHATQHLSEEYDSTTFLAPTPTPPICPQHIGPPCPRYYNNTMPDYIPGANTTIPDTLRQLMTTTINLYYNLILKNSPPTDQSLGPDVYDGVAGQAVVSYRLYKNTNQPIYLSYARQYIETALLITTPIPTGNVGLLEGYVGVYAFATIIYHESGDIVNSQKYVNLLKQAVKDVIAATDDTFDTGRSGTLLAAKLLNNYFGENTIPKQDILTIAYAILENGIRQGTDGYLVWKNSVFPNIVFWGQGHGSTGVLQQLMDIPDIIANQTAAQYIRNTLDYYLTLQLPDGNFPTPLIPPYPTESDVLVQWCHGAPGFMAVLTKAYVVFGDSKYLESADKASDCTWRRGLLTKGLMLCHGVSGNTYMFYYMYKHTQSPKYLYRAIKFQEYTLSHAIMVDPAIMRQPSPSPYNFWGASYGSAVVLWSDMLAGNVRMPGFEPEV